MISMFDDVQSRLSIFLVGALLHIEFLAVLRRLRGMDLLSVSINVLTEENRKTDWIGHGNMIE